MSLANIREKLAQGMEGIIGLTVADKIPDTITLPLAVIYLAEKPVEYDFTAGNASWVYHFIIEVLVNKGASVYVAQQELDQYIDPESEKSIKAAIDLVDLTPDAAQLKGGVTYGSADFGTTKYLSARFSLDVTVTKQS